MIYTKEALEETLDALDALLTEQTVAGFRPLIERAKEQARAQHLRIESLERDLDEAEGTLSWERENRLDVDEASDREAYIFGRAIHDATDVLLDFERGLYTFRESMERLANIEREQE